MLRNAEFTVMGFPTYVNASILLIPFIYGWSLFYVGLPLWLLASFILVLVVSVLIHELGHAWALRLYGSQCQYITLHVLGGHVKWCEDCEKQMPARWKFFVALAGPITGLVLGFAGLVAIPFARDQVTLILVAQVATINISMNLANLFPMFPLDGGQAVLALMRMALPRWLQLIAQGLLHVISVIMAIGLLGFLAWWGRDPFSGFYAIVISGVNLWMLIALCFQAFAPPAPEA